jgi:hypothetical protein
MKPSILLAALLVAFLTIPRLSRATNDIFWEAEAADKTSMDVAGPYQPQGPDEAAKLSGGAWLNGNVGDALLFAEYAVHAPVAGTYHFFVRKFWQHGAFRWKVDDGKWTDVRQTELLDTVEIRQYVAACWVRLDDVSLTAGRHTLRIEIIKDPSYQFGTAYGFDCFLLTDGDLFAYLRAHPGAGGPSK